jgi:hypothetical protein
VVRLPLLLLLLLLLLPAVATSGSCCCAGSRFCCGLVLHGMVWALLLLVILGCRWVHGLTHLQAMLGPPCFLQESSSKARRITWLLLLLLLLVELALHNSSTCAGLCCRCSTTLLPQHQLRLVRPAAVGQQLLHQRPPVACLLLSQPAEGGRQRLLQRIPKGSSCVVLEALLRRGAGCS